MRPGFDDGIDRQCVNKVDKDLIPEFLTVERPVPVDLKARVPDEI
jgi:hypothetical protein